MNRSAAVRTVMDKIKDEDIVVAATGYISREVYRVKDRPLNFYMMGSMGNALAIGIGIAMNCKNKVYVINGDGGALMGLGAMVTDCALNLNNLMHIILDNNCHESTGGQKSNSHHILFPALAPVKVLKVDRTSTVPPRIKLTPKQITERFMNAFENIRK